MLYLATASTGATRNAMRQGRLGLMAQPGNALGPHMVPGVPWAADNGCFAKKWDPEKWLAWLEANQPHLDSCLFATVPDKVGNHWATAGRWKKWAPRVRALGYPLAFVLQDGLTPSGRGIPWDEIDAVFIGGTTEFKLSPTARVLCIKARAKGKFVHMGRVNSLKRMKYAMDFCDSVDGTYLAFGPRTNLPKLLRFVNIINQLEGSK